MKKVKLLIFTLILLLVPFGFVFAKQAPNYTVEEELAIIQELQGYANSYKTENGVDTDATELVFQYLRAGRYSTNGWNSILGTIDEGFIDYVDGKGFDFGSGSMMVEGDKSIDFVHMMVVLNAYYLRGDTVTLLNNSVSSDYTGWAGDLITYLEDIYSYSVSNGVTDAFQLQEYSNNLIGSYDASSFDSADMLADIDALIIYKKFKKDDLKNNLYNVLYSYYIKEDGSAFARNRLYTARTLLGSDKDTIKSRAQGMINNMTYNMFFMSNQTNAMAINQQASGINYYDVVAESFANYFVKNAINSAPRVLKQVQSPLSVLDGEITEVKLDIEGTNNVYTWYISDTEDGEYKKIEETKNPTYRFIPTNEINGKYLKCGIRNEGNEEIFSNPIQLSVVNNPNTSSGVAIVVIFVFCSCLFLVLFKKFVKLN